MTVYQQFYNSVLVFSLLCLIPFGSRPAVRAETVSSETRQLREQLKPSQPQEYGSGNAADLTPLNPSPNLLDLPQSVSEVTIDLNQPITLQQALILARRNNRELQVAELSVKRAQANVEEARSDRYPDVGVSGQVQRSQDFVNQDSVLPAGVSQGQATVQADYDVFTNGQRPASIRAAREALAATEQELRIELWDLQLEVTNDYYDLQQAQELINIAEAAVKNARDTFANTVALEQAGLGTRFDVLRAEVQLADRQQQLTQARGQLEIARRQLAQRLSLADTVNIDAADPVAEAGEWPLSLESSIVAAQRYRAELAEILSEREIALLNRKIARGSLGPFVAVSGSLSAAGSVLDSAPLGVDQLRGDVGYSVGGSVTRTLFDGGAAQAQARQQEINAAIADTQFSNASNVIRFQIEQNYYNLISSRRNISTNRQAVQQAEQSLGLAQLRFREGIGTQLEVSNEEVALTRARSNLLQAIIDYNRSLVGLQRFVADPDLALAPLAPAAP
ncbi:TolC family protein [Lyngbya confervoides]|uniref:TolC family protein n=1 Tax=Lyngbya confervoides BDU141951 TaxID=1574623 RepID=A0ABD4T991_9CYAN|nr:TolC family protein [Lyngbya confervoides]MCM1985181.1 TolC family protein [Lyngbya confervoides BDU141951]